MLVILALQSKLMYCAKSVFQMTPMGLVYSQNTNNAAVKLCFVLLYSAFFYLYCQITVTVSLPLLVDSQKHYALRILFVFCCFKKGRIECFEQKFNVALGKLFEL